MNCRNISSRTKKFRTLRGLHISEQFNIEQRGAQTDEPDADKILEANNAAARAGLLADDGMGQNLDGLFSGLALGIAAEYLLRDILGRNRSYIGVTGIEDCTLVHTRTGHWHFWPVVQAPTCPPPDEAYCLSVVSEQTARL